MNLALFILILSFLGLIIGIFLGKVTEEEIRPGKKYFNYLQILILVAIIISLLFLANFNLIFLLLLILGFLFENFIKYDKLYLYFGLYGLIGYLTSENYLVLAAVLIFIYGLTYGTLLYENKKLINKFVLMNLFLFFITFLFLFTKPFLFDKMNLFIGFILGGFMGVLKRKLYK